VVLLGDRIEVRIGHLDVVAVHRVVSDLQRVDSGAFALLGFVLLEPRLPRPLGPAELIERVVVPLPDDAALGDLDRRRFGDRRVDALPHVGAVIEVGLDRCEELAVGARVVQTAPKLGDDS